jgi:membrane protein
MAASESPAVRASAVVAAVAPARRELLWRLIVTTVGSLHALPGHRPGGRGGVLRVLSVPPLIFALAGAIGYVSDRFTPARSRRARRRHRPLAAALTERAVDRIIEPTIDDVLEGGRFDVISLGFVLALWSGSRALNVFVDTITIMHGLGGHRGIVKTRALSFVLYILAMVTGVVTIPLVVAGPRWSRLAARPRSTS